MAVTGQVFAGTATSKYMGMLKKNMRSNVLWALWVVASAAICCQPPIAFGNDASPLYDNKKIPLEQRVDDLFGRLTPEEKLVLLGGTGFTTQPIPRLGVPPMMMADAGQGVRGGARGMGGPATAFPAGVVMASTWDTNLLHRIGRAIGEEARNKGTGAQIILGPAVNIHRSPQGGRNGEYMSEDPYLAARLAVAYIRGVQSGGVAACIKHFACNNQENGRMTVSAKVDERTLREIYLPAFEAGVEEGGVWSVMSSYNEVNGIHSSANVHLLKDILKNEWGFDGLVMSDWGGVHETAAVQAGNDLEMPTGECMSVPKLQVALAAGRVTQAAVDDSVRRILRTILRVGLMDGPISRDASRVNSVEHKQLAYTVAAEGIVLLKNDGGLLPLDRRQVKSIAVIGDAAKKMQIDALGSPSVRPLHSVQIWDGITNSAGGGIDVQYVAAEADDLAPVPAGDAQGFRAEYFKNQELKGPPAVVRTEDRIDLEPAASPAPGIPHDNFSVRWTGKLVAPASGEYIFAFTGDDGFRVFLDGKRLLDHWVNGRATTLRGQATLVTGRTYDLRVEFFQAGGDYLARFAWHTPEKPLYADAIAAAKASDVAVVCVSTRRQEGEETDRPSLALPDGQDGLIRAVVGANPRTIVVLNNGTPVLMRDWLGRVPALIEAWLPGQEGGAALAAILFGDVNPSGKLPDTLGGRREDYPDYGNYPGTGGEVDYAEGVYVGYRHFDRADIQPLFPFGYGLSYTTFAYNNLKLSSTEVAPDGSVTTSVEVRNTGPRAGEEVAELYVRELNPEIDRPVRELKGFAKVALQPGETKTVSFTLTPRELAYFDVAGHQWKADAGRYVIEVGSSSRDIRQQAALKLAATFTCKP